MGTQKRMVDDFPFAAGHLQVRRCIEKIVFGEFGVCMIQVELSSTKFVAEQPSPLKSQNKNSKKTHRYVNNVDTYLEPK